MTNQGWIDASIPLKSGMVHWPGDSEVAIFKKNEMSKGDGYNLTHLRMCAHIGTHIDAPMHFIEDGIGIDQMPVDLMMGPAMVIEAENDTKIDIDELKRHDIRRGDRVIFKTRNSERCWNTDDFVTDYVYITRRGAEYLVEQGVRLIGIDYLSIEDFKSNWETHIALLGAGIWLLEGLNLKEVPPGPCEALCTPLRLIDSDGSPCRALIKPLSGDRS